MHFDIIHAATATVKQAQMRIAPAQGVLHGPEHALATRQAESRGLRRDQRLLDHRARAGRKNLVGIQIENPVMACHVDGALLLRTEIVERVRGHSRTVALGNFHGIVFGARIEHQHFLRPVHLAQAARQRIGIVEGDDHHRQRLHERPRGTSVTGESAARAAHHSASSHQNTSPHQAE